MKKDDNNNKSILSREESLKNILAHYAADKKQAEDAYLAFYWMVREEGIVGATPDAWDRDGYNKVQCAAKRVAAAVAECRSTALVWRMMLKECGKGQGMARHNALKEHQRVYAPVRFHQFDGFGARHLAPHNEDNWWAGKDLADNSACRGVMIFKRRAAIQQSAIDDDYEGDLAQVHAFIVRTGAKDEDGAFIADADSTDAIYGSFGEAEDEGRRRVHEMREAEAGQ